MENKINFITPLVEKTEEFAKTSFELIKLKAIDKTTEVVSITITNGIIFLVLMMVLFLVTIGVSFWLGEVFGKLYYGFFCVACIYTFIFLVLFLFLRKPIKNKVSQAILSKLLN